MFARPHVNGQKLGMVACACHPSNGKKYKIGRLWPRQPGKMQDPASKTTKEKRAGDRTQIVDHQPSRGKALYASASKKEEEKNINCFAPSPALGLLVLVI
jgi:hypothetical protein